MHAKTNIQKQIERVKIQKLQSSRKFPSLIQQARNVSKSIGRNIASVARGEQILLSEQEKNRRFSICQQCSSLINNRCKECGCNTAIKTYLKAERCPLGKW